MSNESLSTSPPSRMVDKTVTAELGFAQGGSLKFSNVNEIMEVAKLVSAAKQAIPPHLRDNPGACLAICIQASEWQVSPFALASQSYVVNDRMAYMAQLVASIILKRGPIKGRLKYTYRGEDATRRCKCTATLMDGDTVDYETPEIGKIPVKNSPLWKSDPDQQLSFYAARALARRHFPDVLLGIYTPDEMAEETMREVGPKAGPSFTSERPALPEPKPEKKPAPKKEATQNPAAEPESEPQPEGAAEPSPTVVPPEAPNGGPAGGVESDGGGNEPPNEDEERDRLLKLLNERMKRDGIATTTVKAFAVKEGLVAATGILTKDYPLAALQALDEMWENVAGA